MKLHEYQGKDVFRRFGIPVPEGRVATTPEEAHEAGQQLKGPLVAKPNAGSPVLVDGKTRWPATPQAFAAEVPMWVEAGARVVGYRWFKVSRSSGVLRKISSRLHL